MSVTTIVKNSDGYVITGNTNIGRPISITLNLDTNRKHDVSISPALGSPTEEPLVERELINVMMEQIHTENRIQAIFESTPSDSEDKIIITAVANIISREKLTINNIDDLISDETNTPKI